MDTNDDFQHDNNDTADGAVTSIDDGDPQTTTKLLSNGVNGINTNGREACEECKETKRLGAENMEQYKEGQHGGGCFSQRWILAYMGLWMGIMTFLLSSNMSVAIVSMVKNNADELSYHNNGTTRDLLDDVNQTRPTGNQTFVDFDRGILNTTDIVKDVESCSLTSISSVRKNERAEFEWSKPIQSMVLSGYFYGYMAMQIPAGWMATHFGGRRVVGICMTVSCLVTLLTPVFARTNVYLVIVTRILQGMCHGFNSPSYCGLAGVWALPTERSRFLAMLWFGQMAGAVLGYSTSGILCAHGFDNGWASVFYVHGILCVLFVICWWCFVYNTPDEHPRITTAEKSLLLQHYTPTKSKQKKPAVPWRHILTYRPIYAMYFANICDCWTFYLLFTSLPQFMKEILFFDIQSNGLLSCLPFLTLMFGIATAGVLADYLRSKNIFHITNIRKMFQSSAFVGVSIFIILPGFMTCDQRAVVIACICVATFIGAIGMTAGYSCNSVDIAPRYASVIFGITNTLGSLPGIIAPIVVAQLTKNQTSEEWRNVFYISCSVAILGAIVYGLFADCDIASWAAPSCIELDVEYPLSDNNIKPEKAVNGGSRQFDKDCLLNEIKDNPEKRTANGRPNQLDIEGPLSEIKTKPVNL